MSIAAAEVIEDFLDDNAIRVIVLSGAGDKAFVSGARHLQVRAGARDQGTASRTTTRPASASALLLKGSAKPTIAMIRGYCLGGGLGDRAQLRPAHLRRGRELRHPGGQARHRLRRRAARAARRPRRPVRREGHPVHRPAHATRRRRCASASSTTWSPPAELEEFVDNYAKTIAGNAPLSIVAAKRVIDEYMKDADKRDKALCEKVVADCFASQDYVEGRRAFMEKRKPAFTGS